MLTFMAAVALRIFSLHYNCNIYIYIFLFSESPKVLPSIIFNKYSTFPSINLKYMSHEKKNNNNNVQFLLQFFRPLRRWVYIAF